MDLEKEVLRFFDDRLRQSYLPRVGPWNLAGIEKNPYAFDLAQLTAWIGYLQWTRKNGYGFERKPILDALPNFHNMDAILDLSDPEHPKEPEWPEAEFIVGNPPFLGGKKLRTELGDAYVNGLFTLWRNRVAAEGDLVVYWFEKSRFAIESKRTKRAGLLATQGIRGGANRETLNRIKLSGDIFFAESDREWVLDGASVHISMVGFDRGDETSRFLDGIAVPAINADLRASANISQAKRLKGNASIGFMGVTKGGPFDIPFALAKRMLDEPNTCGRPTSDIVIPWSNGLDVTRRNRDFWIIDFPVECTLQEASQFDAPFSYLKQHVESARLESRSSIKRWWQHERPRPDMRERLDGLSRFIATVTTAKYRLFVWQAKPTLPDHQLIAIAFDDDCHFGVLHSRAHELWGLRLGTRLETRPRYTPTTCFETFPFPEPTVAQREEIAAAAKELDGLRNNWLNPPEWTKTETLEFPGSADGPWKRYVHDPDARGVGTVKYPRLVAKSTDLESQLKKRTLTNLYNQRSAWLDLAHKRLDAAVFAAYGWPVDLSDDDLLARLLALNLERAAAESQRDERIAK